MVARGKVGLLLQKESDRDIRNKMEVLLSNALTKSVEVFVLVTLFSLRRLKQ